MKKIGKVLKSRLVVVGFAILLQILWWILFMGRLTSYSVFINSFFRLLSIGILLYLIRKDENSAYKIAWIILVMGVPLFGGVLYLLVGNKKPGKRLAVKMAAVKTEMKDAMAQNQWILKEIQDQDPSAAGNVRYIGEFGAYPVWKNTKVTYYPVGEEKYRGYLFSHRRRDVCFYAGGSEKGRTLYLSGVFYYSGRIDVGLDPGDSGTEGERRG